MRLSLTVMILGVLFTNETTWACGRSAEGQITLRKIWDGENAYLAETGTYLSASEYPKQIPALSREGTATWDPNVKEWALLKVGTDSPMRYQYRVVAGRFDENGQEVLGGPQGLHSYNTIVHPGLGYCKNDLGTLTAKGLGIPSTPNSNWFFAYALADVYRDKHCSLRVQGSNMDRSREIAGEGDEPFPKRLLIFPVLLFLSLFIKSIFKKRIAASKDRKVILYRRVSKAIHWLAGLYILSLPVQGYWMVLHAPMGGPACTPENPFLSAMYYFVCGILAVGLCFAFPAAKRTALSPAHR
jgi:hypothetical protein